MLAYGYAYINNEGEMDLYGYNYDEETQTKGEFQCYYSGDVDNMEFDSSRCYFSLYGPR
jgi:hypothetical protein